MPTITPLPNCDAGHRPEFGLRERNSVVGTTKATTVVDTTGDGAALEEGDGSGVVDSVDGYLCHIISTVAGSTTTGGKETLADYRDLVTDGVRLCGCDNIHHTPLISLCWLDVYLVDPFDAKSHKMTYSDTGDLGDHSRVSGAHLEARAGSDRNVYRVIGVRLRDLGDHSRVSGAHLEARAGSDRNVYRVIGVRLSAGSTTTGGKETLADYRDLVTDGVRLKSKHRANNNKRITTHSIRFVHGGGFDQERLAKYVVND
ncbi:hypothetical protein Sjap_017292 [Stephania japonica]|uniref:Uncharacterized protein n=1 Tax=Stephania japonica TaxID=461633 RepID=A0AAP0I5W1_9MAGN